MRIFQKKMNHSWDELTEGTLHTDIEVEEQWRETLRFLSITKETLEDVREAAHYLQPYKDLIVTKFYDNITAVNHLSEIILQHSTIERLKMTMKDYVEQFFQAEVSDHYIHQLTRIGKVHSRINLTANHFMNAHDMLIQFMIAVLMEKLHKQPHKMMKYVLAIQKLGIFDKQLIVKVYTESTFETFLSDISTLLNEITELDTTQALIEGAERQISETENVTGATEEMSASIQEVASHAEEVSRGAENALDRVAQSRQVVNEALQGVDQIAQIYNLVMEDVSQLEENIEQTQTVIQVIKE
ncbi:MAG TPA: globin-coupled sensor protein, partial [Pseudogracilibacillus sp.]|nr:globin-coupled sensor protein [Pseudogracilibacillus sp.]